MNEKASQQEDWWLDRLILFLLKPILWLIPKKSNTGSRPPRKVVTKEPYGSSEPCYCSSEKKYKHCCKKINKREGKIAYKITKTTKRKTTIKIKVEKGETQISRLFSEPYQDSSVNPSDML